MKTALTLKERILKAQDRKNRKNKDKNKNNNYKGVRNWILENTKNDFKFSYRDKFATTSRSIVRRVRRLSFDQRAQ